MHRRRDVIRSGLIGAGAIAFGPSFWREALAASPAQPGPGPYGPLQAPDANGIRLPAGFKSRVIAQGHQPVIGTNYVWHIFSDGAATYETADGGWILVSNSEFPGAPDRPGEIPVIDDPTGGGASAIRFRADASIASAYRILSGTNTNCAGGATPWGTWLSCEEVTDGRVWECDPTGVDDAVVRPAMGVFQHEAVAVDPHQGHVYLTEDQGDGGFYRFTPRRPQDLSEGLLEIAKVGAGGLVEWVEVPDPARTTVGTRYQVPGSTEFKRGEGIWFDSGFVYVATTSDDRIWAYNTTNRVIEVLYDGEQLEDPPLTDVDNITVSRSGDLFVCEDNGGDDPFDIAIITPDRKVSRFLKATGPQHGVEGDVSSEMAGVVFNPEGNRMYFASQRAFVTGVVYEIRGPFRKERPPDTFRPDLTVEVPETMSIAAFERRGLPVKTSFAEPVRLTFALRTAGSPSRNGAAAPGDGSVRLATASRGLARRSPVLSRLRPDSRGRSYIDGKRRVDATLRVTATDIAGNRRIVDRPVRLRSLG